MNVCCIVCTTLSGEQERTPFLEGGRPMGIPAIALLLAAAASQSSTVSLWPDSTTPGTTSANDTLSVELGVKFRSDIDGSVLGIRFYKGSGNTGTHIGNLWSAASTNLATVAFTGETASGWQHMNFANPV